MDDVLADELKDGLDGIFVGRSAEIEGSAEEMFRTICQDELDVGGRVAFQLVEESENLMVWILVRLLCDVVGFHDVLIYECAGIFRNILEIVLDRLIAAINLRIQFRIEDVHPKRVVLRDGLYDAEVGVFKLEREPFLVECHVVRLFRKVYPEIAPWLWRIFAAAA